MDEKQLSIIIGCWDLALGGAMALFPTIAGWIAMIVGLLGMTYGFFGPLNWSEIRLINPFKSRIRLSEAALKALEALDDYEIGRTARLAVPGKEIKYFAHLLADNDINPYINVYGKTPPSRITKIIKDPSGMRNFSEDGNSATNITNGIIYTDLEIEKSYLNSFITEQKKHP